jgi:hypothetical protein
VLRTVKAQAYLSDAAEGGSKSIVVRCDDNARYTLKFKENGQSPRVLVSEFVGSQLALAVGVPTPEGVLVSVEQPFLDGNPSLAKRYARPVSTGIHFGSKMVRNVYARAPRSLIPRVRNLSDLPAVVAFDVLTNNTDRDNNGNYLLIRPDHHPRDLDFVAIDFGHCFGGPNWNVDVDKAVGTWCGASITELNTLISGADPFRVPLDRLKDLSRDEIDAIVNSVPSEWNLSADEASALKRFIVGQAGQAESILFAHRAKFPNWKTD